MSKRLDWVDLPTAATRLVSEFRIDQTTAEGIVWNALQSGEVRVRGIAEGAIVPQIITKEIVSEIDVGLNKFLPRSLLLPSLHFRDVEIDWNNLHSYAPNLMPSSFAMPTTKPKLTKSEALRNYIEEQYPCGVPANITVKHIARNFEKSLHGYSVSESTVRRAMGRKSG